MPDSFKRQQIAYYRTLQPIECSALGERVYFNASGLRHLLYKGRRPRSHGEQHYRLGLLSYVRDVIEKAGYVTENIKSHEPLVVTWSLSCPVKKGSTGKECMTKVILIRRNATGRLYFLSVMCQGLCRPEK